MKRLVCFMALATLAAGCTVSGDPSLDSTAPKEGSLGNGDFYFTCDDSVACSDFITKNVAKKFPSAVAEGSVFHIQYELHSLGITLSDKYPGQGYTLGTVGDGFLSLGSDGFSGVQAGIGTLWVKDASGHAVDFTTIKIEKPDEIVVYDGAETTQSPSFTIPMGSTADYRTVARQKQAPLAGVFEPEFTSDKPDIVEVVGRVAGTTTLRGKTAGTATVTVAAAGLTKELTITVSGGTP